MSDLPEDSILVKGEPRIPVQPTAIPKKTKPKKGRRNIFVTQQEWEVFRRKADKAGISISDMIRRLVSRYKPKSNKSRENPRH